jgi:hypothetical protein
MRACIVTDALWCSSEEQQLLHSAFSLALIVRFLERAALLQLGELVHPGGYLLHCTFQLEADGSWPHHSPKRLDKVSSTICNSTFHSIYIYSSTNKHALM